MKNKFADFDEEKILAIIEDIYEKRANPKNALRLLDYIAYLKNNNLKIHPKLNSFISGAVEDVLTQKKSFDIAFGLKKKIGRPDSREELTKVIATSLNYIMGGKSKTAALKMAAKAYGKSYSSLHFVFDKYKLDALTYLKLKHLKNKDPLTDADIYPLRKYF